MRITRIFELLCAISFYHTDLLNEKFSALYLNCMPSNSLALNGKTVDSGLPVSDDVRGCVKYGYHLNYFLYFCYKNENSVNTMSYQPC